MEISKFRIWDKVLCEYSDNMIPIIKDNDGRFWIDTHTRYKVEFFSGLNDKNGVEIYDGDKTSKGDVCLKDGVFWIDGFIPTPMVLRDLEVSGDIH